MSQIDPFHLPARPAPADSDSDAASKSHLFNIDRARLDAQLSSAARTWAIEVVDQTTSTNADLLDALRLSNEPVSKEPVSIARSNQGATPARGLSDARVRVAYEQTAGRGRRGRTWVAKPGEALLFSVGGWLPRGIEGLAGLSLAVGLAVHDALRALPVDATRVALKWPNDVLVDGAKVSGILIETARSTRDATAIVIGIGVNLRGSAVIARQLAAAQTAKQGSDSGSSAPLGSGPSAAGSGSPAASASGSTSSSAPQAASVAAAPPTPPTALDAIWAEPSMTDLLAVLLNALATTLDAFGADGFAPLQAAWCEADSYRDQPVLLYEGGATPTSGIGRGVDAGGQLLLETPSGVRAIASGDVSLRPA